VPRPPRAPLSAALLLATLLLSLAAACVHGAGLEGPLAVDAAAAPGGDGSPGRPFASLEEALGAARARAASGRAVRLVAGRYRGPLSLPAGVVLEGPAGAVLEGGAEGGAVLTGEGALTLRGLTVRGGEVALAGPGPWRLEGVRLEGQRRAGLERRGGELWWEGGALVAAAGARPAHGVLLAGGARAHLGGLRWEGGFGRAVEVREASRLTLAGARVRGADTALHLREGEARVGDLEASGGRGVALMAGGGRLVVEGARVEGGASALVARGGARVEVRGLSSVGAREPAVNLVGGEGLLAGLRVRDCRGDFAVALLASRATLRDAEVDASAALGVLAHQGEVVLERVRVRGVGAGPEGLDGDGVVARAGRLRLREVRVEGAAGVGVLAAEGARVEAEALQVVGAGAAGVAAETRAELLAGELRVSGTRGGPAVLAAAGGVVRVQALESGDNRDGALQADCAGGGRLQVERLQEAGAAARGPLSACPEAPAR
jgi:hypothetical protein